MSRNEQRIRKALRAKGYTAQEVVWTSPYGPFEMEGYLGGWEVLIIESPYHLGGYSTTEALEVIARLDDRTKEADAPDSILGPG